MPRHNSGMAADIHRPCKSLNSNALEMFLG